MRRGRAAPLHLVFVVAALVLAGCGEKVLPADGSDDVQVGTAAEFCQDMGVVFAVVDAGQPSVESFEQTAESSKRVRFPAELQSDGRVTVARFEALLERARELGVESSEVTAMAQQVTVSAESTRIDRYFEDNCV